MLTIGSLFSGYGGLDMAVESVIDARTAWVSDIDKGACKVLAHRYPDVPNLGDITTIDWSDVEPVDIITGGSPCQDLSTAGPKAGMTDGTRSNLWVAMREAIAHVQPTFVVWENVRGALSAAAHSDLEPCEGCVGDGSGELGLRAFGRVLGDLDELGYDTEWRGLRASDVGACHHRFRVFVLAWRRGGVSDDAGGGGGREAVERDGRGTQAGDWAGVPHQPDRDVDGSGPDRGLTLPSADFGKYAAAVARQEAAFGYPVPPPTEPGRNRPRLSARFVEWMMGLPAGWITDVPGVTRNEALKSAGNGVVPQQAAAALRDMLPHALAALREGQAA